MGMYRPSSYRYFFPSGISMYVPTSITLDRKHLLCSPIHTLTLCPKASLSDSVADTLTHIAFIRRFTNQYEPPGRQDVKQLIQYFFSRCSISASLIVRFELHFFKLLYISCHTGNPYSSMLRYYPRDVYIHHSSQNKYSSQPEFGIRSRSITGDLYF